MIYLTTFAGWGIPSTYDLKWLSHSKECDVSLIAKCDFKDELQSLPIYRLHKVKQLYGLP